MRAAWGPQEQRNRASGFKHGNKEVRGVSLYSNRGITTRKDWDCDVQTEITHAIRQQHEPNEQLWETGGKDCDDTNIELRKIQQ